MPFWTSSALQQLLRDIPRDIAQATHIVVTNDTNTGTPGSTANAGLGGVPQFLFDTNTLNTDYNLLVKDVLHHDLTDASGQAILVLADLGNLAADVSTDIANSFISSVKAQTILTWIGTDLVNDVLQLTGLAAPPRWDHWDHSV